MASRKEQKEKLRREREEREAAEREAKRRKQLVGYGAGGVAVLVVLVVLVLVLAGGGDSGGGSKGSNSVLPSGGKVPEASNDDLASAAKAAGCELKSYPGKSREHTANINEKIKYDSDPPTEGKHFQTPAEDGSYETSPNIKTLVHSLEHGRIIIWFKKSLPKEERANLKALYDEDTYQMIITPDDTMPYQVATSAWSRDPVPNGTGRLMGCKTYNDKIFDAIRDFKDEHRSNGPEPIP